MPTIHLLIKGKVQGVFYRAMAKEKADELGVTGWVKNTGDGDVEITANGTGEQLHAFVHWCMTGPPKAKVTDIVQEQLPEEEFQEFKVIR